MEKKETANFQKNQRGAKKNAMPTFVNIQSKNFNINKFNFSVHLSDQGPGGCKPVSVDKCVVVQ